MQSLKNNGSAFCTAVLVYSDFALLSVASGVSDCTCGFFVLYLKIAISKEAIVKMCANIAEFWYIAL